MKTRIKEVMVERNITSAKLAELLNVSKATISNLINNKTMPSIDTLERLADVLEVPFVELFQKEEKKPAPTKAEGTIVIPCPHCNNILSVKVEVSPRAKVASTSITDGVEALNDYSV